MIDKKSEELHEAHLHVLVNLMNRDVIMMHLQNDRIACLLYEPGYKPQREIWRHEVKERLEHHVPALLMHLHGNHYNALVRDEISDKFNVCEVDEDDE